jgi:Cupredoxin-like domain
MELGMLDLRTKTTILASAVALAFCIAPLAHAQEATTLSITLKDHRFVPAELIAPVNKPITIVVSNQDSEANVIASAVGALQSSNLASM